MPGFYRWLRERLETWHLQRRFRQRLQVLTAQSPLPLVELFGTELRRLHLPLDRFPTREELNAAYRQRCKTAHPDRGGNATEFQEVCAAYQTLKEVLQGERTP